MGEMVQKQMYTTKAINQMLFYKISSISQVDFYPLRQKKIKFQRTELT